MAPILPPNGSEPRLTEFGSPAGGEGARGEGIAARANALLLAALLLAYPFMQATSAPLDFSITGSVSGSNRQLVLNAAVEPATADNGKTGSLYIWALNNGSWYFLTAAGWRPWNNEEIPPVYRMGALSRQTLPVLDGSLDVSSLVGTEVYVGYGLNLQDMLSGSKYTKIHTISPGDTVPPMAWDTRPPVTGPYVSCIGTAATLSATIDEDGTGYYLVQAASAAAPTVWAVIAANHSFAMTANTPASVNISGLKATTAYKIYFVAKDGAGNTQTAVGSAAVTTTFLIQGGLTWMPVTHTDTWANANAYCAAYNGLGQTGWRMPAYEELLSLYNSGAMSGQDWALDLTWSSSPYIWGYHVGVYLSEVRPGWSRYIYNVDDQTSHSVSCVR